MTSIEFNEWVSREKIRLSKLCDSKVNSSLQEKITLALELLHKLDASSKASVLKSMIIPKNEYRITRVSFSTEYSLYYIGILLVVGLKENDLIEIYSDVGEDKLRYWAVSYKNRYFECNTIDALVEYLENY